MDGLAGDDAVPGVEFSGRGHEDIAVDDFDSFAGEADEPFDVIVLGPHRFLEDDDIEAGGFEEGVDVFEDEDAVAVVRPSEGDWTFGPTGAGVGEERFTQVLGEGFKGDDVLAVGADKNGGFVAIAGDVAVGDQFAATVGGFFEGSPR